MTQLNTVDAARNEGAGYKVDVSRGQRIGRVSSEWFSRPADERYLSLSELFGPVHGRAERSRTRTVESEKIRVEADNTCRPPTKSIWRPTRGPIRAAITEAAE